MTEPLDGACFPEMAFPELPESPYPGLRPFEKGEWPIFFGRERMTDEVIARLMQRQIVIVHGASGGGKSSLVRAGVQARLEQQYSRSRLRWHTCAMRPGRRLLGNLAEALAAISAKIGGAATIDIRRALNYGRKSPHAIRALLRLSDADRVCILIDQFEEIFRFASEVSHEEATLLTDFLVAFGQNPPSGIYLLATMRSEFLGECASFDGLAELTNESQYLLPRMETDDLLRAVCEPAELYNGRVSERLAERLIADARKGDDELPLIQHGLLRLWEFGRRGSEARRVLDFGDYEEWGPLARLLSDHADRVADGVGVDATTQKQIEELFRALTDTSVGGVAIRRPQRFGDLIAMTGASEHRLRSIVDALRGPGISFLTPFPPTPLGEDTTIDISHEALIRCWRRIADFKDGWLQREFRDGLIWRALLVQAESFASNMRNVLSEATTEARASWIQGRNKAWAARYGGQWELVNDLMVASQKEVERRELEVVRERERAEELKLEQERRLAAEKLLAEQDKRAEAERKLASRRRWQFRGVAIAAAVTFALATTAAWQWRNAVREQSAAMQQRLMAEAAAREAMLQRANADAAKSEAEVQRDSAESAEREAEEQRDRARRSVDLATQATNDLVFDLASKFRNLVGVPASTTKDILDRVGALQDRLIAEGAASPELRRGQATALLETSGTLQTLGQTEGALIASTSARKIFEDLLMQQPKTAALQRGLSASRTQIGDIQAARGDLTAALASYTAALDILQGLAASDSRDPRAQADLSISSLKIGDVQMARGDLTAALNSYQAAVAIAERLADSNPSVADWQRELLVSRNKLGDVQAAQGDLDDALASYTTSLWIVERLSEADPSNASWQRDLSISNDRIGDMQYAKFDLAAALNSYQMSLDIANRLAKSDPGNALWQRDLSVSYTKIGNAQRARADLGAALVSYQAALAIRERLANSDSGNTDWQRDLSTSYGRIGDAQQAQGDLTAALASYQAALAIAERLASLDTGNAGWQRDLSASYRNIGDVFARQAKREYAVKNYQSALAIAERLAAIDPTNLQWGADVIELNYDLAVNGDNPGGRFASVVERLRKLKSERKLSPQQVTWLQDAESQLSNLHRP